MEVSFEGRRAKYGGERIIWGKRGSEANSLDTTTKRRSQ
jgi:hypothetical protein